MVRSRTALGGAAAAALARVEHARKWWAPPREVRETLRQVSARNLEADDLTLVSFGTRHTPSSQDDPNRGVGAARDWIFSQGRGRAAARLPRSDAPGSV